MIQITFNPNELKLSLKGHAQYGEAGHDLICASASMLFYTLGQALTDSREMLKNSVKIKQNSGDGEISCVPKPKFKANIIRTYWTVLEGYQLLCEKYPDNVELIVK